MSKGIKRRKHRYIGLWLTLSLASIVALSLPGTASARVESNHCVDINDTRANPNCLAPPESWPGESSDPLPHGRAGSAADLGLYFHEPANTTSSDLVKDLNAYLAPGTSFDPSVKDKCTQAEIDAYLVDWENHNPGETDRDYPCDDNPDVPHILPSEVGTTDAISIVSLYGVPIPAHSIGRVLNGVPGEGIPGTIARLHIFLKTVPPADNILGKPVDITADVVEEGGVPVIKVVDLPATATVKIGNSTYLYPDILRTPSITIKLNGRTTAPGFTRLPNLPNSCDEPQQVRVQYNNRNGGWEWSDPFWPDADKFNVTDCGEQPNERPVIVSGGWSQDAVNTSGNWTVTLNVKVTDNDGSVDHVTLYVDVNNQFEMTDPDGDGIYSWTVGADVAVPLFAIGFSVLAHDDEGVGVTSRVWPYVDVPESINDTSSIPTNWFSGTAFMPAGPHIYSAGFGQSNYTQNNGGDINITACASSDTQSVELYFGGSSVAPRTYLNNDGQNCGAGGKQFSRRLENIPAGAVPAGKYPIEMVAWNGGGGSGEHSPLWPYETFYTTGSQSVPSTKDVQDSLRGLGSELGADLSGPKVKKQKPVKLLDLIREGAGASNLNLKTRAAHSKTTTTLG